MGTGYTRQSAAEIQTGEIIEAAPINAEFNQLQNAFDSSIGHTHDGTVGEGPKINLTNSVTGVLPTANGGNGGINKTDATTAPTAGDDANDGYAVGSLWIDVTNDVLYVCVDATATAAIWQRYNLYDAGLTSIAGLTTAADKMIYTTASDVYAVTDLSAYARTILDDANAGAAQTTLGISTYVKTLLDDADAATARGTLGLGTISTQASNSVTITGGSITGITDLAVADGGTGASTAANARTNLGLVIGTDVEAHDTTLTALAAYNTNGILTQTAADTFTGRTITGTAAEITVTNGSGVSGNPTLSLPSAITLTGKTMTGGTFSDPNGLFLNGFLYGLTLSNNVTDATNDIDISVGSAASDSAVPNFMTLASAITKRLDATWVVGTNQGGLDTGAIANGTYHVFLIQRSDTGVVDVLFSTSATAPTMPTNYDRKRRIGSILREAAAIVVFKQDGDLFRRTTKQDRNSTAAQASILLAVSVPTGINVYPLLNYDMSAGAVSTDAQLLLGGAWEGSAANTIDRVFTTSLANTASVTHGSIAPIYQTNTSAQIYFATTISSGSLGANVLSTNGWIDNRGRL